MTVACLHMMNQACKGSNKAQWWREFRPYSSYVLLLLLLAYLFNQLDRYMLSITIKHIAQELEFGDKGCMRNDSVESFGADLSCNGSDTISCNAILNPTGSHYCKWDYNGQGWDYQILAGPVFILIFTFAGIFIGLAADMYNRKVLLAICLIFWSLMTLATGLVDEYWQLVITRFGLGLGEAGCTPFAVSIIADYFSEISRGAAFGIYNFGIYMGYSLSYAVGNFITLADINGQGWRWAFILPAIPGVFVGILIFFTLKEPQRQKLKQTNEPNASENKIHENNTNQRQSFSVARLKEILRPFLSPSLLLLCIAGAIRNAGGYVWAYNTQPYFEAAGVSKDTIGKFMSWIPLVGGCLGVFFGGFISDRIIKNRSLHTRIFVLVVSQVLAAPFSAGALFLDSPYAFISLIPSSIIGEMWVGVTIAVGVELVPVNVRTSYVAVYLFIISNIGGNVPLLVPPIRQAFENNGYTKADALRGALYILYPGLYLLSSCFFLLTLFVMKRDKRRADAQTTKTV